MPVFVNNRCRLSASRCRKTGDHGYALRAIQSIAYRDRVHVVRPAACYLAQPLFGSALVVGQLASGLAVAQDTALDRLGIWGRSVAGELYWQSFALGVRRRSDDLLGGTLDP